jgi:hypothetical protein
MTEMLYSIVYFRLLFGTDDLDADDTPRILDRTLTGLRSR